MTVQSVVDSFLMTVGWAPNEVPSALPQDVKSAGPPTPPPPAASAVRRHFFTGRPHPSHPKAYKKPAEVEIQARLTGAAHFLCPFCTHFNIRRDRPLDYRSGSVICIFCHHTFIVGICFRTAPEGTQPFNGWYATAKVGWTTHLIGRLPPGQPNIGRLLGTLWWICPCRSLQKSMIDRITGKICCTECEMCYYVSLILYRQPRGPARRTPLDWILPVWDTNVRCPEDHHDPEAPR